MKTLFIHDGGEILCLEHAPYDLKAEAKENPRKRIIWTPRGTWEKAPKDYAMEFKRDTGLELDCEACRGDWNTEKQCFCELCCSEGHCGCSNCEEPCTC
jgi:hypothetical protein